MLLRLLLPTMRHTSLPSFIQAVRPCDELVVEIHIEKTGKVASNEFIVS